MNIKSEPKYKVGDIICLNGSKAKVIGVIFEVTQSDTKVSYRLSIDCERVEKVYCEKALDDEGWCKAEPDYLGNVSKGDTLYILTPLNDIVESKVASVRKEVSGDVLSGPFGGFSTRIVVSDTVNNITFTGDFNNDIAYSVNDSGTYCACVNKERFKCLLSANIKAETLHLENLKKIAKEHYGLQ